MPNKENDLLNNFYDWLRINYGESFSLCNLSRIGVGVHNGAALNYFLAELF